MAAAYDTYDYPSYWISREYEHKSEELAIKTLLEKIPKINAVLELGAGYGRLTPAYAFRAKRIILTDPSAKLLSIARKTFENDKRIKYLQLSLEKLPSKFRKEGIDLVVMIRVIHHIEDIPKAFKIINKCLKPNGYFILEYANKSHLKATFEQFLKGNTTFLLDIFPKEVGVKKRKKKCLPFKNYHPGAMAHELDMSGFDILEKLSVSNIRSSFLKKIFSVDVCLSLEKTLQKPLSYLNIGPSIFLLCRKRG